MVQVKIGLQFKLKWIMVQIKQIWFRGKRVRIMVQVEEDYGAS